MAIKTKRPPMKETVGAQYLCFNTMDTDGRWTSTFAEEVEKTEVVKSVKVTENGEPTDTYASGAVYDSDITTTSTDIEVEIVAFPADTLAKLRGDNVDTDGLILGGGSTLGTVTVADPGTKLLLADGLTAKDVEVSLKLPEQYLLGDDPAVYTVYTIRGGTKQESTSVKVPAKISGMADLSMISRYIFGTPLPTMAVVREIAPSGGEIPHFTVTKADGSVSFTTILGDDDLRRRSAQGLHRQPDSPASA